MIAIRLVHDHEPEWYNGPPYSVLECPIDVLSLRACSLNRHEGNSQDFTNGEVEAFRFSGNTDKQIAFCDIPKIMELPAGWRRVRDYGGIHNYLRYRREKLRKRHADTAAGEQENINSV